jgi:cobyrinic acid a,c-diamide synthase
MQITIPRIVIAGTHSGCGKTTIASGLMAALDERGLSVQPFKTGPDFIDPTHHSVICGRVSRNLDPFMMGEAGVMRTFASESGDADIGGIEGGMGLFDGIEGTDFASTAHVARILRAPVILVVDAYAVSRSVHAVVRGFRDFDPHIRIAGIIYNRIATMKHREMIDSEEFVPALGWIPRQQGLEMRSRHLGLVMAHESGGMRSYGPVIRESCDLNAILDVARNAPLLTVPPAIKTPVVERKAVIGVAHDDAFCFYYQDNLDRLARAGAEFRFFSPMKDTLPDVDALYIGGGYPELHAGKLENSPCRHAIHHMADKGMPIYGECGGFMYLCEALVTADGTEYPMAGVFPVKARMQKRLARLGYRTATVTKNTLWPEGASLFGHEFHYSETDPMPDWVERMYRLDDGRLEGFCLKNTLAGYMHLHLGSTPKAATHLIEFCRTHGREAE